MSDDPLLDALIDAWRDMTSAEKFRLVESSDATRRLASTLTAMEAVHRIHLYIVE